MSDYRQATAQATSWRRASGVHISNPIGGQPMISFAEEDVFVVGDQTITRGVGMPSGLQVAFDPVAVVQLLDPATGQPTGQTITHAALYAAIYSAYLAAATARDAAAVTPVPNP